MYRRSIPTFENFQADIKRINESDSTIILSDLGADTFDKIIANLWADGFGLHDKNKEQKFRELLGTVRYDIDNQSVLFDAGLINELHNLFNNFQSSKFDKTIVSAIDLAISTTGSPFESLKVNESAGIITLKELGDDKIRKIIDALAESGYSLVRSGYGKNLELLMKDVQYDKSAKRLIVGTQALVDMADMFQNVTLNDLEGELENAIKDSGVMESVNEFNQSDIRKLPDTYKNAGFTFKLVKRSDKAAIYKDEDSDTFEVFKIKTAPATTINTGGKSTPVPARERIPGNNDFGEWAYSVNSMERAEARFNELNK